MAARLAPARTGEPAEPVVLVDHDEAAEEKVIASLLYPYADVPLSLLRERVARSQPVAQHQIGQQQTARVAALHCFPGHRHRRSCVVERRGRLPRVVFALRGGGPGCECGYAREHAVVALAHLRREPGFLQLPLPVRRKLGSRP